MLNLFIILLSIPIFFSILNFGRWILLKILKKHNIKSEWWEFIISPLIKWPSLVCIGSAAAIFVFFSFLPYSQNLFDEEQAVTYQDNIDLYQRYSDEYAESARKQIEEYQKLQSEMARTATIQQLQFYSAQQDEVGNALTDRIQFYQNEIMLMELEINRMNGVIRARARNKWYF